MGEKNGRSYRSLASGGGGARGKRLCIGAIGVSTSVREEFEGGPDSGQSFLRRRTRILRNQLQVVGDRSIQLYKREHHLEE